MIVEVGILEQEEMHVVHPVIKMVLGNCFQSVFKKNS